MDVAKQLTAAQQASLDAKKVDLRLSNERYLRDHPEVRVLTMKFMHSVLEEQPDNIVGFASKFFGGDLRAMVESDDSSSSSSSKK